MSFNSSIVLIIYKVLYHCSLISFYGFSSIIFDPLAIKYFKTLDRKPTLFVDERHKKIALDIYIFVNICYFYVFNYGIVVLLLFVIRSSSLTKVDTIV
jgi:hypothetical protein